MAKPKLWVSKPLKGMGGDVGLKKVVFTPVNLQKAIVIDYKGKEYFGMKDFTKKFPEFRPKVAKTIKRATKTPRLGLAKLIPKMPKARKKTFFGLKF